MGKEFLVVNSWIYKIEIFINLTQLRSTEIVITYQNHIQFAFSYLNGSGSLCCLNIVNYGVTPINWQEKKAILIQEFVPADHSRRVRDQPRKLKQTGSWELSYWILNCCADTELGRRRDWPFWDWIEIGSQRWNIEVRPWLFWGMCFYRKHFWWWYLMGEEVVI